MDNAAPRIRFLLTSGDPRLDLGTLISSSPEQIQIDVDIANTCNATVRFFVLLSQDLREHFTVDSSSVQLTRYHHCGRHAVVGETQGLGLSAAPTSDATNVFAKNLLYQKAWKDSLLTLPPAARGTLRLSISPMGTHHDVRKAVCKPPASRHFRTGTVLPVFGYLLCKDERADVLAKVRLSGRICESWLQPNVNILNLGRCSAGVRSQKEFAVRNLSDVATAFSVSIGLRSEQNNVEASMFVFDDADDNKPLDLSLIRVEPHETRRVRVGFVPCGTGRESHWFSIQNLKNASDFWHIQVVGDTAFERIAAGMFVSCGSELDFGDCYSDCRMFREIELQSNYADEVVVGLHSDRKRQISYEAVDDWSPEDTKTHESAGWAPSNGSSLEKESLVGSGNSVSERYSSNSEKVKNKTWGVGSALNGTSQQVREATSDYSASKAKIADSVDQMLPLSASSRNQLTESLALHPGQRRKVRVWYCPSVPSGDEDKDRGEASDAELGRQQEQQFQLLFKLPSGECRTVLCRSQVCESILRLERNEAHLGNCNVLAKYNSLLSIINCSDFPTKASINYVSQCVAATVREVCILPREAVDLNLDFVPRQVNPDYHKEITITNLRNPRAPNLIFTLRANCVDHQGVSLHALFYKITAPNPTNEIDFGVTVAYHPAIRAFKVQNITKRRLTMRFDACKGVRVFIPSEVVSRSTWAAQRILRSDSINQLPYLYGSPSTQACTVGSDMKDADACRTADALIDGGVGIYRIGRKSRLQKNDSACQMKNQTFNVRVGDMTKHDFNEKGERFILSGERSWLEFLKCLDERDFALLDSMPMFFSNYDAEVRHTEKQFRPGRRLQAALRDGYLTETNILALQPEAESLVVVSMVLTDAEVRSKTKIRPIERSMYVRMLEFDERIVKNVVASDSKEMHRIAKLLEVGHMSRPRELLLTVQACKSCMTIAPLHQLNFGVIACGEQKDKAFTIVNKSAAPLLYAIRKEEVEGKESSEDLRFNLGTGIRGVVRPYFSKVVPFIFAPTKEGAFLETIIVDNLLDKEASCGLVVKAFVTKKRTVVENVNVGGGD